jgi:hypothetical protein
MDLGSLWTQNDLPGRPSNRRLLNGSAEVVGLTPREGALIHCHRPARITENPDVRLA